jgi:hypothetical protein
MMAESLNEMGDGTTAATYLEQVRARARDGNPCITSIPTEPGTNANSDKNERRWEFAMEGLRFYDLVRWTPASDGIDAPSALEAWVIHPRNACTRSRSRLLICRW